MNCMIDDSDEKLKKIKVLYKIKLFTNGPAIKFKMVLLIF